MTNSRRERLMSTPFSTRSVMKLRYQAAVVAVALATSTLAGTGTAAASEMAAPLPVTTSTDSTCELRPCMPSSGVSVPGVDVECTPTQERPTPVILLHGTRADKTINWIYLGPELAELGFCVYSVDLPDRGQAPIAESVAALATRVEEVLQATGARRVSLFGHSLGGMVARDYVKRGGGLHVVDDLIAMGTPHYGYYTTPPGDEVDKLFNTECPACWEQAAGSEYLQGLNEGDMTPGSVSYTSIITANDGMAVHQGMADPLETQYLPENERVSNVLLQRACPNHVVDHLALALDPLVRDWVVNALERQGPADQRRWVDCGPAEELVAPSPETVLEFSPGAPSSGQYTDTVQVGAALKDDEGNPIVDALISFTVASDETTLSVATTTDSEGLASASVVLDTRPGSYTLTAAYAGEAGEARRYRPSNVSRPFQIAREETALGIHLTGRGSDTLIEADLGDLDMPLQGIGAANLLFYADGQQIGSATTDAAGHAFISPPTRYRGGHHWYEVRFAGDDFYEAATASTAT